MTSKQVISILRYIAAAYPNFEVTEERVAVWIEQLSEVDYEAALKKVKKHVALNKFPPSIAEVYVEPEKSRINHEHLAKMRALRGEAFYDRTDNDEPQY
jgi:ribosomal protein L12E/L44/L45/RPP1/RPP2